MPARPRSRASVAGVAAWIALSIVGAGSVGAINHDLMAGAFEGEGRTLHRIVSQRADQHDAHLTSLAAILAAAEASPATLRTVGEALLRFYPRITSIDAVSLAPSPGLAFTTREPGPGARDARAVADLAERLQPGQAVVAPGAGGTGYDLVKRVPSGALVMTIDGVRLIESDLALPPGTTLVLSDRTGREIARVGQGGQGGGLVPALRFQKELGSRSQPLLLAASRSPTVPEVLPPLSAVLIAMAAGVLVLVTGVALRERRAARDAGRRASILAHEARLSHAMRVNTVGEMASGIAHELTQPLTAILSQSQAGLRLSRASSVPEEIVGVLESNARLAKRAGDILARLRAYVSNRPPAPEPVALNGLVGAVVDLARADLEGRGIALEVAVSPVDPTALVDRVAIEQVLHNLVRNAADAMEGASSAAPWIRITVRAEGDHAVIAVRDGGPGITPEHLPRLFEPFFTTKEGGMGLGLPLSERLVEGFGGRLRAANHPDGGAEFTVRLPLAIQPAREAAE